MDQPGESRSQKSSSYLGAGAREPSADYLELGLGDLRCLDALEPHNPHHEGNWPGALGQRRSCDQSECKG